MSSHISVPGAHGGSMWRLPIAKVGLDGDRDNCHVMLVIVIGLYADVIRGQPGLQPDHQCE